MPTVFVEGRPTGAQRRSARPSWRGEVAQQAGELTPDSGLQLDFVLQQRQFVDLDTLVGTTVAGLRDAGVAARGLVGVDALLATRRLGMPAGVGVHTSSAAELLDRPVPGTVALDVQDDRLVAPRRGAKQRWRAIIEAAWGGRPILLADVWAEVAMATPRSLLSTLEPTLDALEPCLGRDPRGRDWQEFFPNDDRIVWLRLCRAPGPETGVRLRLGPLVTPPLAPSSPL